MPAAERRPQVVMVDDDPDFRCIVSGWLKDRFDTVMLADGAELGDALGKLAPDLVILDVRMPGANGFTLCRELRAHGRCRDTPILFLTASTDFDDFRKNLVAGGTGYLEKPVAREDLLTKIDALLAEAPLGR